MGWRALRWWLPWLLTLGVSSALAYAAETGLEHSAQSASAAHVQVLTMTTAERWVSISAVDRETEVNRVRCLARPNTTTSDELRIESAEFDRLVANMCVELFAN
jgi:hypothetical protein